MLDTILALIENLQPQQQVDTSNAALIVDSFADAREELEANHDADDDDHAESNSGASSSPSSSNL